MQNKKISRKIISLVLSLLMMLTVVPAMSLTARAEDTLTIDDLVTAVGTSTFNYSTSSAYTVQVVEGKLMNVNPWVKDEARDLTYNSSDGKYHLKFGSFDNDWYIVIDSNNYITSFMFDNGGTYESYSGKSQYALNLSAPATYTVTWKSQDGTETCETDTGVAKDTQPSYDGSAPTKAEDDNYTYTFAGWATSANQESGTAASDLPAVTDNVTYYAAFSKTQKQSSTAYGSYVNTTTVVHFDSKDWYLIEDNSTAANAGTVTLLSKECVAASQYNSSGSYVEYASSTVKTAVDNWYNNNITSNAKTAVFDNKMFLLTKDQANAMTTDTRKCSQASEANYNYWWLCSPGSFGNFASCVYGGNGNVLAYGYSVVYALGVRPALKLDLSKVTFDSNTFSLKSETTEYPLWVGGTQVTSANATDVFSDGKVSYTPATTGDNPTPATLTLNGYTYSGEGHREKTYPDSPLSAIYYSDTDPLTIQLSGTNSITRTGKTSVPSSEEAYGIHSTNCNLTIDGNSSGSLTVTGGELNTTYGIYAKTVTIKNANVTAKGIGSSNGTGINGRQGVTIQNAVVNAEGKMIGISSANNGFTEILGNSSVTATGSNKAINGTVKNVIAGTGWTDMAGTEGQASIAVSTNGQSLTYKKVQFPAAHAHSFTYTAEGDTITATCTATGCDLTDNKVTLKIVPNSVLYYDDNQPKEASLEGLDDFNAATGKSISKDNIAYYKGDTNVTAQIKAGSGTSIKGATYTARLDVEGVRAVATFRLTAKPQPHTHSFTYSANGNVITATCIGTTGTCDLTNKQATLTLNAPEHATYDDGKNANATITGEIPGVTTPTINYRRSDTPLSSAPADAGTYTAWCQLGNATARVEYTVAKAVNPGYTTLPHAVENLVYTGEEQELITSGATNTGQIAYTAGTNPDSEPDVTTGGMPYSYSVPKMTDAGTYYVWCKLDGGKNYTSLGAQKIEVTIAKANPTYTVPADLTATYGDTLSDVILPEGWSWADDTQSVGNAGTKIFKATFTPEDTTNYNTVSDIDVTVTVEKADITPIVSIDNWTYGEKASDPSVEGNSGNGAVTYTYAAKGSDEYVAEAPTNAGEYTVKATIAETANYNAAVATADFEIEKALLTVTMKNQTVNYGSPVAQGKYTVKGLVSDDTAEVELYAKIATNEVKATVKASSNYKVKLVSGILTIKGSPIASAAPSGKNLRVNIIKVQKADGYDIYAGYCGSGKYPLVKSIKGNSVTAATLTKLGGRAIDTKRNVFLYAVAYKMVNGKKVTLVRSASLHIAGVGSKRTNAKALTVAKTAITLNAGKTTTLMPSVTRVTGKKLLIACTDKVRYASCNKSIAKVDASGKITAVAKGTVNIYAYAANGKRVKIVVTVK